MIDFQKMDLDRREDYYRFVTRYGAERGCEYAFTNLVLWGRQRVARVGEHIVFFSQFEKRTVYPYPLGHGDVRPALEAIIADARERGILCRLSGMSPAHCMELEELYPGKFRFYPDRDSCDYVYKVEDLAGLKGRKFQKKRNHLNKFRENHPNCRVVELRLENLDLARELADDWYAHRLALDPQGDYHLEQRALRRAFKRWEALAMEGVALMEDGVCIAFTMGSPLAGNTFDIHFEKAREDVDGAYNAINQAFAAHLQAKYPTLQYLNREDDMGIPGLRQAKLSYNPDHLVVKFWARLWEDDDED